MSPDEQELDDHCENCGEPISSDQYQPFCDDCLDDMMSD